MDNLSEVPASLLHQFAVGRLDDEEIDLLESMLRAEGLEACPPALQRRVQAFATPGRETRVPVPGALERLIRLARPIFDTLNAPPLAGVRGHDTPRQLLLHADDAEISLHLQPLGISHLRLIGQVFGPARGTGEAVLRRMDARGIEDADTPAYGPVAVDDLGEFMFTQIHAGRYVLQLHLNAGRIDSTPLAMGGEPDEATDR